jgi:hypothetical protein
VFGDATEIGLARLGPQHASASVDTIERLLALDLPLPQTRQMLSDELEQRYVERLLARHGGNVTRAAAASGLALRYFKLLRSRVKK